MKIIKTHHVILGSILMVAILFAGVGIGCAGNVLQNIQVDYNTVKKIVIDNQDKTPSSDSQPFVYNGRTYVPLRYIAEALGKPVNWDGATGTITIGEDSSLIKSFSDSLTTPPISSNWKKISGSWTIDGENGLCCQNEGYMALDVKYPQTSRDYSVEWEMAVNDFSNYGENWGGMYFRYTGNDWKDYITFGENSVNISGKVSNYPSGFKVEKNTYYTMKVDVKDGMMNLYINNKYITSEKYSGDKTGFYFKGSKTNTVSVNNYFKNFRLYIND